MAKPETTIEKATTRAIVAASLCDIANGPGSWECLFDDYRVNWLYEADKFIHELEVRDHGVSKNA